MIGRAVFYFKRRFCLLDRKNLWSLAFTDLLLVLGYLTFSRRLQIKKRKQIVAYFESGTSCLLRSKNYVPMLLNNDKPDWYLSCWGLREYFCITNSLEFIYCNIIWCVLLKIYRNLSIKNYFLLTKQIFVANFSKFWLPVLKIIGDK